MVWSGRLDRLVRLDRLPAPPPPPGSSFLSLNTEIAGILYVAGFYLMLAAALWPSVTYLAPKIAILFNYFVSNFGNFNFLFFFNYDFERVSNFLALNLQFSCLNCLSAGL